MYCSRYLQVGGTALPGRQWLRFPKYLIVSIPFSRSMYSIFISIKRTLFIGNNQMDANTHTISNFECPCCGKKFESKSAKNQHFRDKHLTKKCPSCSRAFATDNSLNSHLRDVHAIQCQICEEKFYTEGALASHSLEKHARLCTTCNAVFWTDDALDQHCRQQHGMKVCGECNGKFATSASLQAHYQATQHATSFECCLCSRKFGSLTALEQHLSHAKRCFKPPTKPQPSSFPCPKCKKIFKGRNALDTHLSSLAHNPLSNLRCPLSATCSKKFASPSALLHHLESGKCASGLDRHQIASFVKANDTTGVIVGQSKLLSLPTNLNNWTELDYDSSSDSSGGDILTPTSTQIDTPLKGLKFKCVRCRDSRQFKTLAALKSHLESPKHDAKIFHCPESLTSGAKSESVTEVVKRFTTLSGLSQHLESGKCIGGKNTLYRAVGIIEEKLYGILGKRYQLLE